MQPGFSLVIEAGNVSLEEVEEEIKIWGGKKLEIEYDGLISKYSVLHKLPQSDVTQHVQIRIKSIPEDDEIDIEKKLHILIEVALLNNNDHDEGIIKELNNPKFDNLRPQSIIPSIINLGDCSINGTEISSEPIKIDYDDVDEWWERVSVERNKIPQIIIGRDLNGDLPAKNPKYLAKILTGFAKVYYPASAATMELMNETMGKMKAPRGSVRLILDEKKMQPLYTTDRIRIIEGKRPFELDIFLRIAKKTLNNSSPIWTEETLIQINEREIKKKEKINLRDLIEKSGIKNKQLQDDLTNLDDAYNSLEIEYNQLKELLGIKDSELIETISQRDDAYSEIEELQEQIENLEERNEVHRHKIKQLKTKKKEKNRDMDRIMLALKEITDKENYHSIEELLEHLAKSIEEEEEEEEVEDLFTSVESVLLMIRDDSEWKKKFVISKNAIKSAKESNFSFPRRVFEAFEMMSSSYQKILNKARSSQKDWKDYETIFRDISDEDGRTTFRIANKESGNTMKKYGSHRRFLVEGYGQKSKKNKEGKIEMQSHIKLGGTKNDSKCLRIHFIFDKKSEKFLIGHCGNHLPIN
tara:strand:+ start:102 stop:1850 length:1749 start_codon:yes stop_codon:yes gene_type:complete